MVKHKIFLKSLYAKKYDFIDELNSDDTLLSVYSKYSKGEEYDDVIRKTKKFRYDHARKRLTVVFRDSDDTLWKHIYTES